MSENKRVEEKLREEIKKIDKNEDGTFLFSALGIFLFSFFRFKYFNNIIFNLIERCEYLKAVINETLRLAPPVPL